MYKLEIHLVEELQNFLALSKNPFRVFDLANEFDYESGRTDIIGITHNNEIIAFETKLSNWKKAVYQAYRSTSFAHYSYVVLPTQTAFNALRRKHEFDKRGIGLCSVDREGITIEIKADKKTPIQPWITEIALRYILNE